MPINLHFVNVDRQAVPDTMTADVAGLLDARLRTNGSDSEPEVLFVPQRKTRGNGTGATKPRPRRATGPRLKDGTSLAALRARTGACLALEFGISTIDAARRTGSGPAYVQAWRILKASGDAELLHGVLAGEIALLKAARSVKPLVNLKAAFVTAMTANPATATAFATEVLAPEEHLKAAITGLGVDGVFDRLVG
jgi:hypothetical protein